MQAFEQAGAAAEIGARIKQDRTDAARVLFQDALSVTDKPPCAAG